MALNNTWQTSWRMALIGGLAITVSGGVLAALFPNSITYVYMPGMLAVYALSGGVHGYSSGVYLPNLPLWYALATPINVAFYSLISSLVFRFVNRQWRQNKHPRDSASG